MIVADAIRTATHRLAATSETARMDAELLMAHALEANRSDMLVRHMRGLAPAGFDQLIERRMRSEPVAYITGVQEFFGRSFAVEPGILIPRADSETIIEAALELCSSPRRILDLGTGSGALLLTLLAECPAATGIGTDASCTAVTVARANAQSLELDKRSQILMRDWTVSGWHAALGKFDLVVANPPYVEANAILSADIRDYEPHSALFAGVEGLDDYEILIPQLCDLLTSDGMAIFEIGATQAAAVAEIAERAGYDIAIRHDLANRPRAVVLS